MAAKNPSNLVEYPTLGERYSCKTHFNNSGIQTVILQDGSVIPYNNQYKNYEWTLNSVHN